MSHHAVGEKPAQLLQQLLALQLQAALVAVHTGVAQLLQHLAQLLVHLLGATPAPLELRAQALLAAAALVQEGAGAKVDVVTTGSVDLRCRLSPAALLPVPTASLTLHVDSLHCTKSLHRNTKLYIQVT